MRFGRGHVGGDLGDGAGLGAGRGVGERGEDAGLQAAVAAGGDALGPLHPGPGDGERHLVREELVVGEAFAGGRGGGEVGGAGGGVGGLERGAEGGPAAAAEDARLDPFGQVGDAGERVLDGAGHGAERQALGERIDRLEGGEGLLAAGAEDVVGVGHLGDAVEELDPAGDDAALAGGEGAAEPVGLRVEEDELELGLRVADVDAVGAAAHGGRLVQADLDLDGDDLGQMRLADRAAEAPVGAGGGEGQDEVGGVGDLHLREEARDLRADPGEGGRLGEEREEDGGAAHGRRIVPRVGGQGKPSWRRMLSGVAPSARRVARERASSRLARRRPLSSRMRRWWCQTGTGRPRRAWRRRCSGVASRRSAPRTTWVTPWWASSRTTARW